MTQRIFHGPQPISSEQRRHTAQEIAQALQQHYQERLLALGIYGSLGRGSDGPYSDIEMHCIVQGEGIEQCFEWSTGPWKAEVDVYSSEVILGLAAEVEGDWAITHGAYVHVLPLHDPERLFSETKGNGALTAGRGLPQAHERGAGGRPVRAGGQKPQCLGCAKASLPARIRPAPGVRHGGIGGAGAALFVRQLDHPV